MRAVGAPAVVGLGRAAALALAVVLASCANPPVPPLAPPDGGLRAGYVVLGPEGVAVARVITPGADCPSLEIDGHPALAMDLRVPPGTAPRRPAQAKAAAFPVRVCEKALAGGAGSVRVRADPAPALALPPPRARFDRIVVLGDTGCRIKAAERAFQDCTDPRRWPFAQVAASAARERPDLVVHVGDYHYRESACPDGEVCAGSPWGYGWDAWMADFFEPARPLLAAAPWVVARGNHEECARAGQGWFRTLDPQPYDGARSCDDPAQDEQADFSAPYAVPLGGQWQIIVFDSALASRFVPSNPRMMARYAEQARQVRELASVPGMRSFFLSHHPVLGFAVDAAGNHFGTPALLQTFQDAEGPPVFPPGIEAALHGHVHAFQAIDFASEHPATLVAGHGGDNLDADVDARLQASYDSAPAVRLDAVAHARSFGYLVLERGGAAAGEERWVVHARRQDGSSLLDCTLARGHLVCNAADLLRPVPPR